MGFLRDIQVKCFGTNGHILWCLFIDAYIPLSSTTFTKGHDNGLRMKQKREENLISLSFYFSVISRDE